MKNMIIIVTLFLAIGIAFAAPEPHQFVTNNQTNECGFYWPGDEFVIYGLPENWTVAKFNETMKLQEEYSLNSEKGYEWMNTTCQNMNYTYIGELTNLSRETSWLYGCLAPCPEGTVRNETCGCDNIPWWENSYEAYALITLGIIVSAIIVIKGRIRIDSKQ